MRSSPIRPLLAAALAVAVLAGCSADPDHGALTQGGAASAAEAQPASGETRVAQASASDADLPWALRTATAPASPPASAVEVPEGWTLRRGGSVPVLSAPLPPPEPRPPSVLDGRPGFHRVPPESLGVVGGKRLVPAVSARFERGERSLEALAGELFEALRARDFRWFTDLHITREEFETIVWPELPQSHPRSNITPDLAWRMHYHESLTSARDAMAALGGQDLELRRIEVSGGEDAYRNFTAYCGVRLVVADPGGLERTLTFLHTAIERQGRFKVYIFKD